MQTRFSFRAGTEDWRPLSIQILLVGLTHASLERHTKLWHCEGGGRGELIGHKHLSALAHLQCTIPHSREGAAYKRNITMSSL